MKLIVACDVSSEEELSALVHSTADVSEISGYKLGALAGLTLGLPQAVAIIKKRTSKMVVYDHQKAGNDIPDISRRVVQVAADAGAEAFICFPFAGLVTMKAIIDECRSVSLLPILGGHMTHEGFLMEDGGFIPSGAPERIYEWGLRLGVKDFVVPGNVPETTGRYANMIKERAPDARFWCPGMGRQGGDVASLRRTLGTNKVFAIVGSSIYQAEDPAAASRAITRMES